MEILKQWLKEYDIHVQKLIIESYQESHRKYHNLNHIIDMIDLVNQRNIKLKFSQQSAILFHDIVYDPESVRNEEDSANVVRDLLRDTLDHSVLDTIEQIILDTKTHTPTIEESKIVIDLDLFSLSKPWDSFFKDSENIRKEYSYLNNKVFLEGRIEWIKGFLNREHIYYTKLNCGNIERTMRESMAHLNLISLMTYCEEELEKIEDK